MPGRRLTSAQRKRNREAADWIMRNSEPGQSEAEKAAFRRWMDADPDNCRTYEAAGRLLKNATSAIRSDPGLRDFRPESAHSSRSAILPSITVLAALGGLFVALDGPMRLQADVMAGVAEMPVMTLEDGSTMHLNASSAVAFDYSEGKRVVKLLRGEAFFQVAPDASRPFSVETGDTRVTALGTAFDVRAGQTATEVVVTEHVVAVEAAQGGTPPVRVREGESVSYDRNAGFGEIGKIDSMTALAWRRGQLSVENAPLSYVVEEMNRHYSGRIVIAGNALSARRVSGTISITDTDAALGFLRTALGVRASRIGPLVVIRD